MTAVRGGKATCLSLKFLNPQSGRKQAKLKLHVDGLISSWLLVAAVLISPHWWWGWAGARCHDAEVWRRCLAAKSNLPTSDDWLLSMPSTLKMERLSYTCRIGIDVGWSRRLRILWSSKSLRGFVTKEIGKRMEDGVGMGTQTLRLSS